ncbi:MAG: YihY/virulence factor BrkB family protein [Proteocatella sp.]
MKKQSLSQKYTYPLKEDRLIPYAVKALYRRYTDDNLSQIGGQLAYFFILSLFPLLMLLSQVIGMLDIKVIDVASMLMGVLPEDIIDIILDYLVYVQQSTNPGIFTFSAVTSIYIASKALTSIIYALNKAYRVDVDTTNIQKKIISFVVTLLVVVSVILSLVLITIGKPLFFKISVFLNIDMIFLKTWTLFRWAVAFSILFITLFTVYSIIPSEKFPKKFNIIGTIFTIISWMLLSLGFAYYVNNISNYYQVYGSLGTVMLMLLYLYFAGIIIVLGGELSHILAQRHVGNYDFDVKPPGKTNSLHEIAHRRKNNI